MLFLWGGGVKILIVKEIKSCSMCPYVDFLLHKGEVCRAPNKCRKIMTKKIPKWCPLPEDK